MDIIDGLATWDPSPAFRFVDVTGVVANGLLGGMVARAKRFDLVGFLVLGILSGLGGGMVRDVLLQRGYPVALTDPLYLTGALAASFVAFLIPFRSRFTNRLLNWADILALGCWSATGAQKAHAAGLAPLPSILLGVVTAVGGGMVRDVIIGETPRIFGGNPLDATVAVLGATIAFTGSWLGHPEPGMALAIVVVAVTGMLARRFGWVLPFAPEWHPAHALRLGRFGRPRLRRPSRSTHSGGSRRARRAGEDRPTGDRVDVGEHGAQTPNTGTPDAGTPGA